MALVPIRRPSPPGVHTQADAGSARGVKRSNEACNAPSPPFFHQQTSQDTATRYGPSLSVSPYSSSRDKVRPDRGMPCGMGYPIHRHVGYAITCAEESVVSPGNVQ